MEYKRAEMDFPRDHEEQDSSEEGTPITEEELEAYVRTKRVKCCVCSSEDSDGADIKYEEKHMLVHGNKKKHFFSRKSRCCCCHWPFFLSMFLISLFALMAILAWWDGAMQEALLDGIVMKEGSPKDQMWRSSSVDAFYKVWIFNLTNPREFMAGDRPRVLEVGPYVYKYRETKHNVRYNVDGTVLYQGKPYYEFQPHLSHGREEDMVTTVNIPYVNAAEMVKNVEAVKTIMKIMKKLHSFDTVRSLTVGDLLWGHRSRVLDWARTLQDVPYPHQLFGLLMGLNDTLQPPYVIHTGLNDVSRMNQIVAWNKRQLLDFWFGTECNIIKGTDGNGFAPGISKEDKLFIFNGQLCRSLSLVYNSTFMSQGLEAYRFVPPEDIFAYGPRQPDNQCYCSSEGCPARGLIDMKPCYFGASVAFSFPHFYTGDAKLRHVVKGLRPDPEKHRTEFDIYPDLGVPLRVKLRMQMNVMLDRNQALERARHYDLVLPIFWFEVGIDSLPGEVVGLLKLAQNLPPVVKTTSVTLCTALTIIFLLLLLAQTITAWCGWRSDDGEKRIHTPEPYPDHQHPYHPTYLTPPPWDYDASQKPRRGGSTASSSLASTLPPPGLDIPNIDDHTLLPPYRRRHPLDMPDNSPQIIDEEKVLGDQVPPPYSPGPFQRTPSTVSVEIHTTASDDDLPDLPYDPPVTKVLPLQHLPPDYQSLIQTPPETLEEKEELEDYENEDDEEEEEPIPSEPEKVSPSTPPPLPGELVVAPLAKIEDTKDIDVNSNGVPSPLSSPRTAPPLATSSPHGSSIGNDDGRGHLPPPLESDL